MNYLAHAYLSFNKPEILVGNIISDFVKGKRKFDYPISIQQGITLHRAIDTFTDSHTATAAAKEIFRPAYRLYAGAFIDVVYDHFLANDKSIFSENALYSFSQEVYQTLEKYQELFPDKFNLLFPYMKKHNWLYHYQGKEGIRQSFGGLMRRSVYINEITTAYTLFEENYSILQQCYDDFFPSIKQYAWQEMNSYF